MKKATIITNIRAEAEKVIREPGMRSKRKKKTAAAEIDDILFGRCRAALLRKFPAAPPEIISQILMDTIYRFYLR